MGPKRGARVISRTSRRLWLALLYVLCGACPSGAHAWTPYSEHGAVWRNELALFVSVPASGRGAPELREALLRALALWSGTRCAVPRLRLLGSTVVEPNVALDGADGLSVVGFERSVWRFGEGATALTRIREQAGAIVEADIVINAVNFEWRTGAPAKGSSRLRMLDQTLPHELGHALGLGHSQERGALMHEALAHDRLAADDVLGLCALYPARSQTGRHPLDRTIDLWLVVTMLLGAGLWFWYARAKRRTKRGATDSNR